MCPAGTVNGIGLGHPFLAPTCGKSKQKLVLQRERLANADETNERTTPNLDEGGV